MTAVLMKYCARKPLQASFLAYIITQLFAGIKCHGKENRFRRKKNDSAAELVRKNFRMLSLEMPSLMTAYAEPEDKRNEKPRRV